MSNIVISVEQLTKQYDLGVIGTGTLSRDLNRWWAKLRRKPDPYTRIGQKDHFERLGESILALDDVSFTVNQGEALGIIGKNGAGKSTLLKILSRVTAPSSGVVKIRGRIGSLLEVGTGFHPELTGRENVYLNGAILGMRKEEVDRKFDEIVDFSGVEKFIDTPVKRYSSGMYVRLAFAVAAHLDPEILVVDEVLAVGDVEFQKKCLGKMGDVAEEGRTVLFVSHNMGAIRQLCTRGILLSKGVIAFKGSPENTVDEYLSKTRESKGNNIISHITKCDPIINIQDIIVNQKNIDELTLTQNDRTITIEVIGSTIEKINLDIEFRLSDRFDNVLAIFAPGFISNNQKSYSHGNFRITRTALLPKGIQAGQYYLDIYLTNPNVYGWVDIPKAVLIHHLGLTSNTGKIMHTNSRNGWIFLEEKRIKENEN
jgi:lipopolysaccharide transport system ATP-binding protein